jgi:hypothetical protein
VPAGSTVAQAVAGGTNTTASWSWAVGLLLAAAASPGAERPLEKVPREVKQAEQALTKWLDGFKHQTPEEVRKSIGAPTKETTWLFREKKELLLEYRIGDSTQLSLYFHKGRVVKAGLLLLP